MAAREHVSLIDGNNMLKRAWAMAPRERSDSGQEVGATLLLARMMMKMLNRMAQGNVPPTTVLVFFDPEREGTWRRALSPAYKANRPDPDPDFASQLPLAVSMCEAMGLRTGVCETHEADDMIAAYAADARAVGMNVSVISADKDLMQLVGNGVLQHSPISDVWFNAARVREKFGVGPELLGDLLALTGDSGDGIVGASKIGQKSAAALLGEFGSLEGVLTNAHLITREGWRRSIEQGAETVRLARRLVTLDAAGCPRPFALAEQRGPDPREVWDAFRSWSARAVRGGSPDAGGPSPS